MPVITCKKCPCQLRVRDDSDGDTVRCPNCGHSFKCVLTSSLNKTAEEIVTCYVPDASDAKAPSRLRDDEDKADAASRSRDRENTAAARRPRDEPRPARRSPERDYEYDDPRPPRMRYSSDARRRRSSSSAVGPVIIAVIAVVLASVVVGCVYLILSGDSSKAIPKSAWKPFEEPNRYKIDMPGSPKRTALQAPGGLTMVMQGVECDRDTAYLAGASDETVPPDALTLPVNMLLDNSCDAAVAEWASLGGVEKSRESIRLGPFSGRQTVVQVQKNNVRFIARVYLANNRIYTLVVAGKGYSPEHDDVKRYFNSFEIIEVVAKFPQRGRFAMDEPRQRGFDPPQRGFDEPPQQGFDEPPQRGFDEPPQRGPEPARPGRKRPDRNGPPKGNDFEPGGPAPKKPQPVSPEAPPGTRTTDIKGGHFDTLFRDVSPEDGLLVGLEVGLGTFINYDIVVAVRPVYRVGSEEKLGNQWGEDTSRVVKVVAKPGYAVGAISVKTGLGLDSLSVIFMKVVNGRLDPRDKYRSDWIGGPGGGGPDTLAGDGLPVVGIVGKTNREGKVSGIGLMQKTASKKK